MAALAAGFALAAQPQPQTATATKKPAPQTQAHTVAPKTKAIPTAAKKSTATKSTGATKSAPPPVRHYAQQQPTSDRYKEIQQALMDRGYFKGQVDGQWGPESVEALKQFQREQKIDEDGKINSLSLIALGLGPHRNLSQNQTARTAPVEAQQAEAGPAPSEP